jgi:hypothetical protein
MLLHFDIVITPDGKCKKFDATYNPLSSSQRGGDFAEFKIVVEDKHGLEIRKPDQIYTINHSELAEYILNPYGTIDGLSTENFLDILKSKIKYYSKKYPSVEEASNKEFLRGYFEITFHKSNSYPIQNSIILVNFKLNCRVIVDIINKADLYTVDCLQAGIPIHKIFSFNYYETDEPATPRITLDLIEIFNGGEYGEDLKGRDRPFSDFVEGFNISYLKKIHPLSMSKIKDLLVIYCKKFDDIRLCTHN